MAGGVERLLRAADRFQQRHTFLAMPVGEERRSEETVEVRLSSEADGPSGGRS